MKKVFLTSVTLLTVLTLAACSSDNEQSSNNSSSQTAQSSTGSSASSNADVKIADGAEEDAEVPAEGTVYMRQLYAAPHGDQSFAVVNVTMNGDTIVSARLDEFQYVDKGSDWTGVPSSDGAFGEAYPDGKILIGKEENNEAYSELMASNAGATQTWKDSMDAITSFVAGKTVEEVEAAITELKDADNTADVVTGATFSDASGYLQAIADAATSGIVSEGIATTNNDLKEAQVLAAPHGDRSFGVVTVAMDGDVVAATFLDEFQYVDPADYGAVPNSDAAFGEGIADGQVLASKLANNEAYSELMASAGGSTMTWLENIDAIDEFAKGKTIEELQAAVTELNGLGEEDSVADVVTGATFEGTAGYLEAIIEAAQAATAE